MTATDLLSAYVSIAVLCTIANMMLYAFAKDDSWSGLTKEETRHLTLRVLLSPVWPLLIAYTFHRLYNEFRSTF